MKIGRNLLGLCIILLSASTSFAITVDEIMQKVDYVIGLMMKK